MATPPTAGDDGCAAARQEAASAWTQVAERATDALPADREATDADRALARLHAHLAELETSPRALGGDEAMALSTVVMDAIDAQGSGLPAGLRDRADDAAEALLTDRSEQGAARAAQAAVLALQQVVEHERPGAGQARERRQTLEEIREHARRTAAAYREQPPGDAEALAARATLAGADGPATLRAAQAEAAEASAQVRQRCRGGGASRPPASDRSSVAAASSSSQLSLRLLWLVRDTPGRARRARSS